MILWVSPGSGPGEAQEPHHGPKRLQGPSKLTPKGSRKTFELVPKTPKTVFLPTRNQHGGGNQRQQLDNFVKIGQNGPIPQTVQIWPSGQASGLGSQGCQVRFLVCSLF